MSIETELNRIKEAKTAIGTSIGRKGVQVPADAMIDAYPALIDSIQTGGNGVNTAKLSEKGFVDSTILSTSTNHANTFDSDMAKSDSMKKNWTLHNESMGKKWYWDNVSKSGIIYGPEIDLSIIKDDEYIGTLYDNFPDMEIMPEFKNNILNRFPMDSKDDVYSRANRYLIKNCPNLKKISSLKIYPNYTQSSGVSEKFTLDKEHRHQGEVTLFYCFNTGKEPKLQKIDELYFNAFSTFGPCELNDNVYPAEIRIVYCNDNGKGQVCNELTDIGGFVDFAGDINFDHQSFMGSTPNVTYQSWRNIVESIADLAFIQRRIVDRESGQSEGSMSNYGTGGHIIIFDGSPEDKMLKAHPDLMRILKAKGWKIVYSTTK